METTLIFPTPIWITTLDVDCEKLKEWAYELKAADPSGVQQSSSVHGYQSKPTSFSTEQLLELQGAIVPPIHTATSVITGSDSSKSSINLTNTWININAPGSLNKLHTHAIATLSGVFYVDVPENSGALVFRRTGDVYAMQGVATTINQANHTEFAVTPSAGMLVLFPSWMDHSVEMNESDEDRISIAFNVEISKK